MKMERGVGNYLREAISFNISIKWGVYSRVRRLIEGWLLFERIRYFSDKKMSCKGIGPKGRAFLYNTLLSTPWQNPHNCITLLLTKKNYPDETSRCSKTNALLERQRPKKCEPQLLRSLPLLIPLEKAQGWEGGGYSTNIWVSKVKH